eukprot:800050-Rhodomonas_salina.1
MSSLTKSWSGWLSVEKKERSSADMMVFVEALTRWKDANMHTGWYHFVCFGPEEESLCSEGGIFPIRSSPGQIGPFSHLTSAHLHPRSA